MNLFHCSRLSPGVNSSFQRARAANEYLKSPNIRFMLIGMFCTMLLSGCNSIVLFYDFGPSLARWQIDSYFDLNGKQDDWLEKRLKVHFAWHRSEELEDYIEFLKQVQVHGGDGLTLAELKEGNEILFKFQNRIAERIIPDTALFLSTTHEFQVEHLEKEMLEENMEFEESRKKSRDRQANERLKSLLDTLEDWLGDLSDDQIREITRLHGQWNGSQRASTDNWIKRRKKTQKSFLALLRGNPETVKLEAWLRNWLRSWTDPADPVEKDRRNRRIRRNMRRILQIDALLTTKQRQHAVTELQDWIDVMQRALTYH